MQSLPVGQFLGVQIITWVRITHKLDFLLDLHAMQVAKILLHEPLRENLLSHTADLPADVEDLHVHADEDCQHFREIFGHL